MYESMWSHSEKKLSRRVFELALEAELAEIVADFKSKAAAVATPEEMWALREFLSHKQREIDQKYDYRYSQLTFVFSRLLREGRIRRDELHGLSEDKLSEIERILSL